MFAIKKICLFIILILFFTSSYSQEAENKNSFTLSLQAYGLPIEDMDLPGGFIADLGYDIIPKQKQKKFSIEYRIGGGGFVNSRKDGIPETQVFRYSMTCLHTSIAPKLYLNLNMADTDKSAFLYLENEFSVLNTFATIEDYHVNTSRKENEYLHFYYSCKLGASVPLHKKYFDFWAGYTTLDFTKMLNRNLPADRHRFAGQYLGVCWGMSFHF